MDLDWDALSRGAQQRRLSLRLDGEDCQDDPEELIRGDARAVNCIRGVLIAVLVFATLLTAVANCTLLGKLETRTFSKDFDAISTKLIQSFLENLSMKMWQAYTISITMTGANILNSTIPFFDQLSQASRATTHSSSMVFSPLLYDDAAKIAWESYAMDHIRSSEEAKYGKSNAGDLNEWNSARGRLGHSPFQEGFFERKETAELDSCRCENEDRQFRTSCRRPTNQGKDTHKIPLHGNICQIFNVTDGIPVIAHEYWPYSPAFQVSSTDICTANLYNLMSESARREAIEAIIKFKHPVLTRTQLNNSVDFQQLFPKTMSQGPAFSTFYPIFNDLSGSHVTGTVSFDFSWTSLLNQILHVGSEGVELVLENTCNQKFTFSVAKGSNQLGFVGEGDLHDIAFDQMKERSSYDDFKQIQLQSAPRNRRHLEDDVDCKYRIHVYPSAAFLNRYKTSTPGVVTAVMVITFLLKSIVFFAYDRLVRRLQRKVMRSAVRYNSFLSTLFPSTVRSRLFNSPHRQHKEVADEAFDRVSSAMSPPRTISFLPRLMVTPKLQLKNYLESTPTAHVSYDSLSEPIADLFPHTTVFFADIAGFTAWSSEREPLNVFKLLETLYSAFDRIAARLGVFKVETVGDCYVAVTGLPEPQEDHAIITPL